MNLKAIVLDIDGTLLNAERIITTRTKDKLIAAQKQGIKIILASGRPTQGMLPLAEELEMEKYDGFLVSYNGASVYDVKREEILYNQGIPTDLAHEILAHLQNYDLTLMVDQGEYMYVNDVFTDFRPDVVNDYKNIVHYETDAGNFKVCEVNDFTKVITEPVNKILVAGDHEYIKTHEQAMRSPFEKEITAAFSTPFYFEYTNQGIDKAKALNEVLSDLDIFPENVVAFGDGQNDRSIIEYAGVGVAMENAVPEIKEIADEVTGTNEEDGIAAFLDHFF